MTKKFLFCHEQKKKCPFRTLNYQLEVYVCEFYGEFWRVFKGKNEFALKTLFSRACEAIRTEEARHDFIIKIAKKKTLDFLQNAQVGDTVFCRIAPHHKIKLLKRPLDSSEFVSCQAPNGVIIRIQAHNLGRISSKSFYGEYLIDLAEGEKKVQELEYKAMDYGFRTEVEKKPNGYLFKIYGDSQQEVDDFIILSLENDFDISPFI